MLNSNKHNTPAVRSGCSESDPTWPWLFLQMGVTSLGNLLVKNVFVISTLSVPSFNLKALPPVPLQLKRLPPSFSYTPFSTEKQNWEILSSTFLNTQSCIFFTLLFWVCFCSWVIFFLLNDCKNIAWKFPFQHMSDTNDSIPAFSVFHGFEHKMCCILYQLDFLQISMIMSDQYSDFANRVHQWANAGTIASMKN